MCIAANAFEFNASDAGITSLATSLVFYAYEMSVLQLISNFKRAGPVKEQAKGV